jgi:hypothetical protein
MFVFNVIHLISVYVRNEEPGIDLLYAGIQDFLHILIDEGMCGLDAENFQWPMSNDLFDAFRRNVSIKSDFMCVSFGLGREGVAAGMQWCEPNLYDGIRIQQRAIDPHLMIVAYSDEPTSVSGEFTNEVEERLDVYQIGRPPWCTSREVSDADAWKQVFLRITATAPGSREWKDLE